LYEFKRFKLEGFIIIGYEFGIDPTILAAGDLNFINDFKNAEFHGIGYLSIPNLSLENKPLEIGLIFRDNKLAEKAFGNLMAWVDGSNGDGDAVAFDFVESKNNGYTLCIYPDPDRLIERCIPKSLKDWIKPLVTFSTYFKQIDNVSEYYSKFKNASRFSSLKVYLIKNGRPMDKLFFIKNKVNFYTEENLPNDSFVYHFFQNKNKHSDNQLEISNDYFKNTKSKEIEGIEDKRLKKIQYFFPITFEKVNNNTNLSAAIKHLREFYSYSQILQAICNIVLNFRLEKEGYQEITKDTEQFQIKILEYMLENYEDFNSPFPDFDKIDKSQIEAQIKLDVEDYKALLKEE
jgi:hypothetical protein